MDKIKKKGMRTA